MDAKSIADIPWTALLNRTDFHPSPIAWEDEILYFLLPDRFSNNAEKSYIDSCGTTVTKGTTPLINRAIDTNSAWANATSKAIWQTAGNRYVGGSLVGITSKLGYLRRLGITTIWLGPVFKQVPFKETYHGYGVQGFLDVEPRLGTREDLKTFVQTAHENGIKVILDIILNHSGDVFAYKKIDHDTYWDGTVYPVEGFRDATGAATLPFGPLNSSTAFPNSGVWPAELQSLDAFTRKGYIQNWDYDPEYREGDFYDLKDINIGTNDPNNFVATSALQTLVAAYKFWIAFADLDGFRIDTVKHMGLGPTRFFASAIHEFAQSIGKENFFLVGEITGGRVNAFNTVEITGLDAALGIDDIQDKLEYLIKGQRNPADYFNLFRNSLEVGKETHAWFRDKVVTMIDDHDQIRKGNNKARFCADPGAENLVLSAIALNLCTLGIPCLYYGTEQAFDGHGDSDIYIREAMFGGEFGAFRSRDRHVFDESTRLFKQVGKISAIRSSEIALRKGRQYLREISGDGMNFGVPTMQNGNMKSIVAWSRIMNDKEVLCAINTDADHPTTAWVTVDYGINLNVTNLACLYSTKEEEIGQTVAVESRNGRAIELTVPPGGFVLYK